MMTRREALLQRGGIDPFVVDRRSFSEILKDEIPEARWAEEAKAKAKKAKA